MSSLHDYAGPSAASVLPPAHAADRAPAAGGLSTDASASLPSVGRGKDLPWAKSWSELSDQMKSIDRDAREFAARSGQIDPAAHLTQTVITEMGRMVQISGAMSQGVMRFTLVTGAVNNTSTAVNKLLTQQ